MSNTLVIDESNTTRVNGWYEISEIEHDGDVRVTVDRLRVMGRIDVRGSIVARGHIDAGGDIYAGGYINAGYINARGHIDAGGDICAGGYINAGYINARGYINAGGYIYAGGDIYAGGYIYAGGNINARGTIYASGDIDAGGNVTASYLYWAQMCPPKIRGACDFRVRPAARTRDFWARLLGEPLDEFWDDIEFALLPRLSELVSRPELQAFRWLLESHLPYSHRTDPFWTGRKRLTDDRAEMAKEVANG